MLVTPLTVFPLRLGQAVWNGVGTAGLVWVLTTRGWWGLLALGGTAFLRAFFLVQWSPVLLTGLISGLGFLWAAKPTIGVALFAGWPSRSALLGGSLLTILSLVLIPKWPFEMRARLAAAPHIMAPLLRPGGFLLLLALLRWRRPEARMLAALSLAPQTTSAYEMLPLFLIPRSAREMTALVLLSQLAFGLAFSLRPGDPHRDLAGMIAEHWPFWLCLMYLPSLWLVLRRPNESLP